MDYPLNYDDSADEWMAFGLAVIVTGLLSLGGYGVYKLITKNKDDKPKTEQVAKPITPKHVVEYNYKTNTL